MCYAFFYHTKYDILKFFFSFSEFKSNLIDKNINNIINQVIDWLSQTEAGQCIYKPQI
jgi:hypothetical protein